MKQKKKSTIKMPKNGSIFSKYCKSSENCSTALFQAWADMIIAAACYGCHKEEFDQEVETVSKTPDPIDLTTFQNRGLYNFILIMALKQNNNPKIVDDADSICKIIEGYASSGFRHMQYLYDNCGGDNSFIDAWEQEMQNIYDENF